MLRDFGLLESAVLRPQATALLHSLARNHHFVDGNKRTAWAATAVFYQINRWNGLTMKTRQMATDGTTGHNQAVTTCPGAGR